MTPEEVDRQLHSILSDDAVSRSERDLARYASDALRPARSFPGSADLNPKPGWVVWPSSVGQVLGLEVVLGNGEVMTTRAVPKSSTGPSLHQLFVGSEGCLGIVTAATLRLFPEPERRKLHALSFPNFETGYSAVQHLFDIGL